MLAALSAANQVMGTSHKERLPRTVEQVIYADQTECSSACP